MEVLFITHKYPPSIGGMEKQSYELINGAAKSCRVHTLIHDNGSSKLMFFLSVFFRVKRILRENPGISLIHVNDGLMAIFGFLLKKITRLPVLATFHGLDIVFPSKFFQRVIVRQFRKLDGVVAVSHATALECIKRGFDRKKIYIVKNGVDTELSEIPVQYGFSGELEKKLGIPLNDKKVLVSVGRSVKRKGFSWFINSVLPKLPEDFVYIMVGPPQAHIRKINFFLKLLPKSLRHKISLILGLGMDEIEIRESLKKPGIQGRAFYMGKLPFQEMAQILKLADLFVMPNIKVKGDAEGFGLVALEATVSGLPVLASAIEGITDAVVDGKNGFLVPAENPDAWVGKINTLLSDRITLKKFGESAKHYTIKNYAWEKMVEGYMTIFRKYETEQNAKGYDYRLAKEFGLNYTYMDNPNLRQIAV